MKQSRKVSKMKDLPALRREYSKSSLTIESVNSNPIVQFEQWMKDAINAKIPEPNAMTLATASKDGRPSARIVLLKGVERGQFIFYTNYQSLKGKDLADNPVCSLNFFWSGLERQVTVKGIAERIDEAASDAYFQSRPRDSQVVAWTSPQSSVIKSRKILEERRTMIEDRYANKKVLPRPKQWGGYQIAPYEIEFWQGRPGRMHDRIVYSMAENQWSINRLAP